MTLSSLTRPQLFVRDHGTRGPALVFLHYFGGTSRTWQTVIDALPADIRTIAPDLRGWGQSERPLTGYTLNAYADDIEALLISKGVADYVLVGHSMGGKIAQVIASRRPKGLRGVVLVAPSPPTPLVFPPEALAGMQTVYDTRESIEGALAHMLTATPLSDALREQVVTDSLGGSKEAKAAWPDVLSQEDITTAVRAIDVPVLVISGDADKVDTTDTLRVELLPRITTARMHVLPGVGHLVPLEAPVQAARLIKAFVESTAAASLLPTA
jgi:pimeloyl-ACP methyl ester carboxylesterase